MWARGVKLLAAQRCVFRRGVGGAVAAVHSERAPILTSKPALTGYAGSAVPWRRRTCVVQRICPYSTEPWDNHAPSSNEAPNSSELESRAEDLPEFNIHVLVNLLRQENAKDLCVIRIPPEMKYAEYFVIVGGMSTRHLKALAQYTLKVYKYLKKDVQSHICIEGQDTDDWMCIDFGNIVVHFMLPEAREAYELEKLWTLRSHDDQLTHMVPEVLPSDFTFGFQKTD